MPYRYAGCIKSRPKRLASSSLEWCLLVLLTISILTQIFAVSPAGGMFFWWIGFLVDFAMFVDIYLIIVMRRASWR